MYRYFKIIASIGNGSYICYWQSKRFSDERLNSVTAFNYKVTPNLNYYGTRVEFNGRCLKEDKITYTHGKIVNIYIVYELTSSNSDDNDPTAKNSLFGAGTLTKNADIDKDGYSGYGIGFDRRRNFSFLGTGLGQRNFA